MLARANNRRFLICHGACSGLCWNTIGYIFYRENVYRGHSSAGNTACSMMLTIHGVLLDIILLGGVQAQRLNYNAI